MDHDQNFKELLSAFFIEFVELFLPEIAAELDRGFAIVPLDKEMLGGIAFAGKREADMVMRARFRGEDACFLIHLESQATAQADFPERMFRYFARLSEKFGERVYPVVVFSYDMPSAPAPDSYTVEFPGKMVLQFCYRVIQLNQIPWREYARRENPVACALMAKMQMEPGDRPKVKLECLRLLATLQIDPERSRLIGAFIDSYLKLTASEMKQYEREFEEIAPDERQSTMALVSSWEQKGIDKGVSQGLSQGISQGISQGMERIVERQIRKRLGGVPAGAAERLRTLSADDLDSLGEALLDFKELSDLEQWLARNLPN